MKKTLSAVAVAAALTAASGSQAIAGGLFGNGGLIRGDIGNFFDEHVEKPVLTPLAKDTAVAAGAAAGAVAGAKIGAPDVGAVIGAGIGQAVNDLAAGK